MSRYSAGPWPPPPGGQPPYPNAGQPYAAQPYSGADLGFQGNGDPRYPSPRRVRQVLAFAVDLALSLGSAVGAFFLGRHVHQHFVATYVTVDALAALVVVSFVHRTIVQWAFRTTLGKALFGLVLIRREDGGRPGFWKLVGVWFTGIWYGISAATDTFGNTASGTDYKSTAFLPAVRFRDVRALRRARTSRRR